MKRRALLLGALALGTRAWAGPADQAPALLLARPWQSGTDLADWWVSEKYDGVRGFWDGSALRTRGGERIAAPPWFTAGWPATPLDGELWAGRGGFEQAQSTVARQSPDDAAWRRLRYMVFDLQALLREVVGGGGEGLMLHRGSSHYRAGRCDELRKLKPHDDAEARVIAHLPGRGRHAGRLGALWVQTPEGRRFALGSGFTDAQRADPPPVGSWVTYRHRGVHPGSGLPRFASFLRVRADEARFRP